MSLVAVGFMITCSKHEGGPGLMSILLYIKCFDATVCERGMQGTKTSH